MKHEPDILTKSHVAAIIGKSPQTINHWLRNGQIEAVEVHGRDLVRLSDCRAIVAERRKKKARKLRIKKIRSEAE